MSVIFESKYEDIHSRKLIWKRHLSESNHFVSISIWHTHPFYGPWLFQANAVPPLSGTSKISAWPGARQISCYWICKIIRLWCCRHWRWLFVNQLIFPYSASYMPQWIGLALIQIMACRLFGAMPLSEPMLEFCELDPWEQISVKSYSKFIHFHSQNVFENVVSEMAAVVACGKSCSDHYVRICQRQKWNFHRIWISENRSWNVSWTSSESCWQCHRRWWRQRDCF